jgi:hypothetical protein
MQHTEVSIWPLEANYLHPMQDYNYINIETDNILKEAGTAYPSRAPEFNPDFFACSSF